MTAQYWYHMTSCQPIRSQHWPGPRGEQQQTIKGWICKNSSRDNSGAQWVGNHCTMPSTIRIQCSAFLLHCRVRIIEKITSIIIMGILWFVTPRFLQPASRFMQHPSRFYKVSAIFCKPKFKLADLLEFLLFSTIQYQISRFMRVSAILYNPILLGANRHNLSPLPF